MARTLTKLSQHHQADAFRKQLVLLDPRIKDIESGFSGNGATILVDMGNSPKLPINVLGDGFCRMSLMICGMFHPEIKLLIVDEIDSGLHISNMSRFWKTIHNLAVEKNRQIFCTTHNEEMLSQTLEAFHKSKGELRIFRINRLDDGEIKVTKYSYDTYLRSVKLGLDIR